MATVSMSIARDNGIVLTASSEVPDDMVIDMSGMIGAMIFDASLAMPTEPTTRPPNV